MQEALVFLKNKIKDNQTLVVACSGGPDSMALLYLTNLVKKEKKIKIVCAHVNHNVRKESKNEAIFVKKFCEEQQIIFELKEITNYENENFHNYARNERYNFFQKIIDKYQADYLLTAHHGDDLIETIMMRLVRGSSLKGYAGFAIESNLNNMKILRPLIYTTKLEIETWDKKNNIPYVIDHSNEKDVYTRNRYRKYLLPFLKKEDPNVHRKFYQFSEEILNANNYIEKEVNKNYNQVVIDNKINIKLFWEKDIFIQQEILKKYLIEWYSKDIDLIQKKHISLLFKIIKSKKKNETLNFPLNSLVIKENNFLYLIEDKVDILNIIDKQILDTPFYLPNNHVIKKVDECETDGNDICRLNFKDITLPLYIRTRQNGDKMLVKNMNGHKNINDILMENNIHPLKRDTYPIIEDAKGTIVWLPNLKKSQFDKTKSEKYDIILRYY